MEFAQIWNKYSGERISTYVILGERGSRCCILNGAAARTCQPGDQVIICNSIYMDEAKPTTLKPKVLTFDADNNVVDHLTYSVSVGENETYRFEILNEAAERLPVPLVCGRS